MSNIVFQDNGHFRLLCNDFQRALPSALSQSLNKVAFDVMRDVKSSVMPSHLTLRNKFTQAQFQVDTASRVNLKATVGFTEAVPYMIRMNEVSTGLPKPGRKYIPIPMPEARVAKNIKKLVSRPKSLIQLQRFANGTGTIIRKIKGDLYIVLVKKGKFTPLYLLKPVTHYTGNNFKFEPLIYDSARRHNFEAILMTALMRATRR